MKEYIKPIADIVMFESEEITSDFYGLGVENGDISNTLNSDEWNFV